MTVARAFLTCGESTGRREHRKGRPRPAVGCPASYFRQPPCGRYSHRSMSLIGGDGVHKGGQTPSTNSPTKSNAAVVNIGTAKIESIQALRGVAIAAVLLQHISLVPAIMQRANLERFTMSFYLGVDLFFVISGYVVLLSLDRIDYDVVRFLVRRVFRLYPAMLAFLALSLLINVYVTLFFGDSESARQLFIVSTQQLIREDAAVLTGTLIVGGTSSTYYNGVMCSLSLAFQFYAAVAAIALTGKHLLRWDRSRMARTFLLLAVAGVLTVWIFRVVTFVAPNLKELPIPLPYLMRWRFDFLLIGVAVFYLQASFGDRARSLGRELLPAYYLALAAPFLVLVTMEPDLSSKKPFLDAFGYPFAAVCFALVVFIAGTRTDAGSFGGRLRHSFAVIGDRSYTLYLVHFPLFVLVWTVIQTFLSWTFFDALAYGMVQATLLLGVSVVVVNAIYARVEVPMVRHGKQLEMKFARDYKPRIAEDVPSPVISS